LTLANKIKEKKES